MRSCSIVILLLGLVLTGACGADPSTSGLAGDAAGAAGGAGTPDGQPAGAMSSADAVVGDAARDPADIPAAPGDAPSEDAAGEDAASADAVATDAVAPDGAVIDLGQLTDVAPRQPDSGAPLGCGGEAVLEVLGDGGGAVELRFDAAAGAFESPNCGPGRGGERVVALRLSAAARVSGRLVAPAGGALLALRGTCDAPESELSCDAPAFGAASVSTETDGPATLFFIAEGGAFEPAVRARLEVEVRPFHAESPPSDACPELEGAVSGPAGGGVLPIDTADTADVYPACAGDRRTPERRVILELDAPAAVDLSTSGTERDTLLGLWTGCDPASPSRACDDDSGEGTRSRLSLPRLDAGVHVITVEAVDGPEPFQCDLEIRVRGLPALDCADGLDNDGDARVDAADPGCRAAGDPSEADEDDASPSDCADGLDNDGDGALDHPADADCAYAGASAEAGLCGAGVPYFELGASLELSLDFAPEVDRLSSGCSGGGSDHVFALWLETRSRVEVTVSDAAGRAPLALAAYDDCAEGANAFVCRGAHAVTPLVIDDHPAGYVFFSVESPPGAHFEPVTVRATVESLIRACNDGDDDDADGLVDLMDPGCAYDFDDDETHDPLALAVCGDGLDNDGDLAVDYPADPECVAAGSGSEEPSCATDVPLTRMEAPGGRLTLHTEGRDRYFATCGEARGPEQVLALRLDEPSDLSLVIENNDYDTVLFVRRACDDSGTEIGCNDDTNMLASVLTFEALDSGTYFVFLDGYGGARGTADLVVTVTPAGPR